MVASSQPTPAWGAQHAVDVPGAPPLAGIVPPSARGPAPPEPGAVPESPASDDPALPPVGDDPVVPPVSEPPEPAVSPWPAPAPATACPPDLPEAAGPPPFEALICPALASVAPESEEQPAEASAVPAQTSTAAIDQCRAGGGSVKSRRR